MKRGHDRPPPAAFDVARVGVHRDVHRAIGHSRKERRDGQGLERLGKAKRGKSGCEGETGDDRRRSAAQTMGEKAHERHRHDRASRKSQKRDAKPCVGKREVRLDPGDRGRPAANSKAIRQEDAERRRSAAARAARQLCQGQARGARRSFWVCPGMHKSMGVSRANALQRAARGERRVRGSRMRGRRIRARPLRGPRCLGLRRRQWRMGAPVSSFSFRTPAATRPELRRSARLISASSGSNAAMPLTGIERADSEERELGAQRLDVGQSPASESRADPRINAAANQPKRDLRLQRHSRGDRRIMRRRCEPKIVGKSPRRREVCRARIDKDQRILGDKGG